MPKTVFLSACSLTGGSLTERADAGKKRRSFCDEKENTGSGRDRRDGLLSCSRASVSMGYAVDGVTPDHAVSDHPDLRYILTDASKDENLFPLLQNEYAGIVDFLIYSDPAKTFLPRRDKLLESTGHYLFLSSYRVYADRDAVTTEESPRLLDVSTDKRFLALQKGEYSLYKALGEDILRKAARRNYSIVRPAVTYSKRRFQPVTLEAPMFIRRIWAKKTVLLPKEALSGLPRDVEPLFPKSEISDRPDEYIEKHNL